MQKAVWLILSILLPACAGQAGQAGFEPPCALLDLHDADQSCWKGMNVSGIYPVTVVPERWLVGPPPSASSAVTIPTDHWVELGFSGALAGGDGNDLIVIESGKAGEHALLFLTDGIDQEYLLGKVVIPNVPKEELTYFGLDLDGVRLPFAPRAVRLVAMDLGGLSPGFDLNSMVARVSHDCGMKACCPNPLDGAAGVRPDTMLTWSPGFPADRHVVYLGTVASEVRSGASAVRHPAQPGDVNVFEPPELHLGRTYYWRIDELGSPDGEGAQTGDLWSFTVADHLVIDSFESIAAGRLLYDVWQPGGWAQIWLTTVVWDTCRHSLVLDYYYDHDSYSEIFHGFEEFQDWTRMGAKVLQLLLYGGPPDPASGELYIVVSDGVNEQTVPCSRITEIDDSLDRYVGRVLLADFNEVDLTRVRGLIVGVRSLPTVTPGQAFLGSLGIAEIGLYPAVCLEDGRPRADLTADCAVDYRDLERLAHDWLSNHRRRFAVSAPNEPILWYEFEGSAYDSAGSAHGQVEGRPSFAAGVYGRAIHFVNQGDGVTVPDAVRVFAGAREALTIAFWQQGSDSAHLNDTICCSNYEYGKSNPALAIHLGCWRNPGCYRWDCGQPWSFANRVAGRHRDKSEWAGRWNHWAFTKDIRVGPEGKKGRMAIFLNGELYDSLAGTDAPISGITSFEIGSGWYGRYDGLLDDFQVYDYALSPAEIAYVATDGTGVFSQRPASPADLDFSEQVSLRDFAILAAEWLADALWP